jgi:periplasmic protein TonB
MEVGIMKRYAVLLVALALSAVSTASALAQKPTKAPGKPAKAATKPAATPKPPTESDPFDSPGLAHFGDKGVTAPKLISRVAADYTEEAFDMGILGIVELECIVKTDGTISDVRVTKSLDVIFGLDAQAIAAAKQWTFKPGLKDGVPVPMVIPLSFAFKLRLQ